MPYTPPTVNYANRVVGATWYSLSGVQSVNITRGKQRFQDNIPQSNMVVELIPATSYTLPLAVGQLIDVRDSNDPATDCYFAGIITDIERRYDFPYNSSTGSAPGDRIRITAASAIGAIGTAQTTYTWSNVDIETAIGGLSANVGVPAKYAATSQIQVSNQTFTGAALDGINRLARSGQVLFDDLDEQRDFAQMQIVTYPIGTAFNAIAFTDTGSGYKYASIDFLSSVQSTFNNVTVEAEGLADQTASAASPPYNSLVYTTYNKTTADALNLANYLYNTLSVQTGLAPYMVSTNTMMSPTAIELSRLLKSASVLYDNSDAVMGQQVSVTFRGDTSYGLVIGVNSNFYPDYASVQLYLSPSLGTPFTLDSTAFGVLDTNRLGYP